MTKVISLLQVLLSAIKELTPPLNKKRIPSFYHELKFIEKDRIYYVIRGVLFFTGILIGLIFSWLHVSDYATYYFTSYPSSDKYIVDSGILSKVHIRKGENYLLLIKDDGTKIRLKEFLGFNDIQKHYGSENFRVKIWWFPLKFSCAGWIANMEIENKKIVSEYEQQSKFNQQVKHFTDVDSILIFFLFALLALMWEFTIQYNKSKTI